MWKNRWGSLEAYHRIMNKSVNEVTRLTENAENKSTGKQEKIKELQ